MNSLRLAFLTPEYPTPEQPEGGLANYIRQVTRLLAQRGHAPTVFVAAGGDHRFEDEGVAVRLVRCRQLPPWLKGPWGDRRLAWKRLDDAKRLARSLSREHALRPFDLIQSSSYRAVGGGFGRRCPAPHVVRVSSYSPLLRSAWGRPRTPAEHRTDWLEVAALQAADARFAPSRFMAAVLERYEALCVEVVPSPYLPERIDEDDTLHRELLAGKRYVLYFGHLSRIKGVDVLAQALPAVMTDDPELHAVLIGRDDGLPDGRACRAMIAETLQACADRVHVLATQPKTRLWPILRHAALVVLPSRVDNYPQACLEAQALGKIVVASASSSLEELVEDGVTGFLAEPGSAESLAAALRRALSLRAEERRRMETAVMDLARRRDPEGALDLLLDLYERTLHAWPRRPDRPS